MPTETKEFELLAAMPDESREAALAYAKERLMTAIQEEIPTNEVLHGGFGKNHLATADFYAVHSVMPLACGLLPHHAHVLMSAILMDLATTSKAFPMGVYGDVGDPAQPFRFYFTAERYMEAFSEAWNLSITAYLEDCAQADQAAMNFPEYSDSLKSELEGTTKDPKEES